MKAMIFSHKKQSQFEFFPAGRHFAQPAGPAPKLIKDLTVSLENIIVVCIIFIMATVFVFSLGVERGKRITQTISLPEKLPAVKAGQTEPPAVSKEIWKEDRPVVGVGAVRNKIQQPAPAAPGNPQKKKIQEQYTVQIASFKEKQSAHREAKRLEGKGWKTFVFLKGTYSIVCVGYFAEENEAKAFSRKLKDQYKDCLVRRL